MLSRANALHPFAHATGILDNGCGPGPVMSRVIQDYGHEIPSSSPLTCADFSDGMLAQVRAAKERAGLGSPWARVEVRNQNAMDLCEVADGSVSHVTAGMVYFMVPDPQKALKESLRVLRPEGVLALSAWEGSEWLDLMNLLPKVRPDKTMPTMPGAWTSTGGIKGEMEKAGFRDVEVHECPVTMAFQDYEEDVSAGTRGVEGDVACGCWKEVARYWLGRGASVCVSMAVIQASPGVLRTRRCPG